MLSKSTCNVPGKMALKLFSGFGNWFFNLRNTVFGFLFGQRVKP